MCKTGKINLINLFSLLENENIYIYIYIYIFFFFGGFPIIGMKKKKRCRKLEWATAHFFSKCESQYSKLYCDTGFDRHGLGDRPG